MTSAVTSTSVEACRIRVTHPPRTLAIVRTFTLLIVVQPLPVTGVVRMIDSTG